MRYGFYLPTRGETAAPEALAAIVTGAERWGFHSVMIADHVVIPTEFDSKYPYTATGAFPGHGDSLEQLSLMSFVAAKTERLRLVTSVMVVPYRNPVLTAKMLATIDVLSGGRVTVGVGVGWLREEFEALGSPEFDRRGAATDEYLEIFKTIWTEDPAEYKGQFYSFAPIHSRPQPVQKPHPPIWIGGHSGPALRRTARYGDGWHPVGATAAVPLPPDELQGLLDKLKRLTEAEGRDFSKITLSYKAPVDRAAAARSSNRQLFFGSGEQIAEDVRTFAKLGISELVFDFRSQSLAETLDGMERFAKDVMPLA